MLRATLLLAGLALLAMPATADWDPGDPHKMHFPQLPDPQGWDVKATYPKVLADDWLCTETGPVSDIHFWGSWREDREGQISAIRLSIHSNDPGPPSKPVNPPLWVRDFFPGEWKERFYGQGEQGWYDPNQNYWKRPDHFRFFQYNFVDIPQPFTQKRGEIYWLDVSVRVDGPEEWGWKTTRQHWMDDAVWGDYPMPEWRELRDPITNESLDLAFVITPEPAGLLILGLGTLFLRRR